MSIWDSCFSALDALQYSLYPPKRIIHLCHGCFSCQGRQVEAKRVRESRGKLGDEGAPELESQWQTVLEEKDAESQTRENKLREQISDLKKKVYLPLILPLLLKKYKSCSFVLLVLNPGPLN